MTYYYYYQTEVGKIYIVEEDNAIVNIKYKIEISNGEEQQTALIKETCRQLIEYFDGKRKKFDIPIKLKGTSFQQKVWSALQTIPYGEVWSYKYLAETIGSPKGYRAVGMANNHNPISIIVPCHRVIGSDGSLVGYAGGLDRKKLLLEIEQKNKAQ
ncbi:MAG: methylated-DNA--[protein]-cysteine S-methyltransferase [Bacteroidales bacterium]|jgi:methylated-DNA-[protein]-cysteine S-methyltransferase|nr:methylated-DNA--[protein]-cysteine S-methyltransferase [Bacteroidales bacterium]